jgi:flagellar L-ring protein precursor FlgH
MKYRLAWTCAALLLAGAAGAESLYEAGAFRSLTSDHRAYREGDVITVLIVESSSATTTADTATDRRGGVGVSIGTTTRDERASVNVTEDYAAKGRIQRSGRLLAQLSATVVAVLANGDLQIVGSQLIEVNSEKQHIQVEGRVRPVDVTENNAVLSTRIADARIVYVGQGLLGEKQRPGILTRFLGWLGIL